jgi:hypothetical protein
MPVVLAAEIQRHIHGTLLHNSANLHTFTPSRDFKITDSLSTLAIVQQAAFEQASGQVCPAMKGSTPILNASFFPARETPKEGYPKGRNGATSARPEFQNNNGLRDES